MATVVHGEMVGRKLLISAAQMAGGIRSDLDAEIGRDALDLLRSERSELRTYSAGDEQVEVFIEVFPPPQRLVIIGGVHVAIPLHRIAKQLGYHVTVVDARGTLATAERFPMADSLMVAWPDEALALLDVDSGTSIVVLTHDPKFDHPALMAAVRSAARYIGAIGSRTTNEQRKEALQQLGATDEQLARIHAPVGLDIGAKTPAEIALAIMGEIVAARYGRSGGLLSRKT